MRYAKIIGGNTIARPIAPVKTKIKGIYQNHTPTTNNVNNEPVDML